MTQHLWGLSRSDRIAFSGPDGLRVSYADFLADVDGFAARLGAGRGILLLKCTGHYRQYVAYMAALSAKCPVILADAAADPSGQPFPVSYVYAPDTDRLDITGAAAPDLHDDLAVLLSTSGSTGAAKSVRLSHRNILSNADAIVEYLGIAPDDRAVMALPFQYSYGMSVVNSHLRAGARIVLNPHSVSSAKFWDAFAAARCTSFAGVPHSFDLIEQARIDTGALPHLRTMTQAGGRMPPDTVRAWAERSAREGWRFVVMYGQTEAAPRMAYLPPEAAADHPAAIGRAIPGGTLAIRDEAGRPLPDGTEGELVYRGPNVMMGYARTPADLALGQGPDILRTGDLARRDAQGFFTITGRQSRFVKLYGYRIALDEIDARLKAQGIDAASIAIDEQIHVVAQADDDRRDAIAADLAAWLTLPAGAIHVHPVASLPRNANGKIDGRGLRDIAVAARGADPVAAASRPASAQDVFRTHFPNAAMGPRTTFVDLGGDSLNYLSVALDLEALYGDLPEGWETLPAARFDTLAPSRRAGVFLDILTLTRALAIVAIVAGHLGLYNYGGGGAYSLFLVAGCVFGAFTLPAVLRTDSIAPVAVLGARVGLFTLLVIVANWLLTGYGAWSAALFVSNWIDPDTPGAIWFVEVYLQSLIAIGALLLIPDLRAAFRDRAFAAATIFAAVAILICLAMESLADFNALYRRLPFLLGWIFLVGLAVHHADTALRKALVTLIAATAIVAFFGPSVPVFFVAAVLAVVWLPGIRVPRAVAMPVRSVASASLAIYLTHFQFASIVGKLGLTHPAFGTAAGIVMGVVVWRLYLMADRVAWRTLRQAKGRLGRAPSPRREA
ncbi:AMP-dependent synthetase and ligase [Oceaniovalibus guishaninsula JLT2003]|uniref:AMP-dependent synthetase and ligase n=1 Tax=Oceaniovalibus guishaninsula JLT2003 TaxID=1231392 RepID=K2GKF6_9RHOB|nr:AMP-binding protein [Oceaniovalibus guishaninsula]EKE43226.1 AMP-dependent synthetase and ligase [Oceaniovalibus guishaninsula JLT2003]